MQRLTIKPITSGRGRLRGRGGRKGRASRDGQVKGGTLSTQSLSNAKRLSFFLHTRVGDPQSSTIQKLPPHVAKQW